MARRPLLATIARCALVATGIAAAILILTSADAASGTITTVAGGGVGDGGPATSANLWNPVGVALSGAGALYVADTKNCRVRTVSGGTITTVAGNGSCSFGGDGGAAMSARISQPIAVTTDGTGSLYVADQQNCVVRRVSGGTITTVAGNRSCTYGGDGGPATSASFLSPSGVAADGIGNLYIADEINCRIRRVSGGIVATIAGDGFCRYVGDGGAATSASVYNPLGLAVNGAGDLFIADSRNCRVRKVSGGTMSTVAGNGTCAYGGDGGAATDASLDIPSSVAVDGAGDLFIADTANCRIREVSPGGTITTVAGDGSCAYGGDGGVATSASLSSPAGIAVDASGDLFVGDTQNCRVRKVSAGGTITTAAGDGSCTYGGDGGPATSANLSWPGGIAIDADRRIYISDTQNCRVRRVTAGTIATVAGNGICAYGGDGGVATSASLSSPNGVAVDGAGNFYIADLGNCRVRKVSGATITTVAGNGICAYGGDGGSATSASLFNPGSVAIDTGGNLYISDAGNCRVREVSGGTITTIAGNGSCTFGGDGGTATSASLNFPVGVAFDSAGNLYVSDFINCRVRRVSGGTITTVAGNGYCGFAGDGGIATNAVLSHPAGLTFDAAGDLYIADSQNSRVRKVSGGTITTVAGNGFPWYDGDGVDATSAALNFPYGVAPEINGGLYIADSANRRIRKVTFHTVTLGGVDGERISHVSPSSSRATSVGRVRYALIGLAAAVGVAAACVATVRRRGLR